MPEVAGDGLRTRNRVRNRSALRIYLLRASHGAERPGHRRINERLGKILMDRPTSPQFRACGQHLLIDAIKVVVD
jgi:hypothetical protein